MNLKFIPKKIVTTITTFMLCAICLFGISLEAQGATVKGFNFKAGDILVTSDTISDGITGHAGIVAPDGKHVIHVAGKGKTSEKILISTWLSNYDDTEVIRCDSKSTALDAAEWAEDYYIDGDGADTPYKITTSVTSKKYTYCSKIVWQAYYYGADFEFETAYDIRNGKQKFSRPTIISPYEFGYEYNMEHNGFDSVKSY